MSTITREFTKEQLIAKAREQIAFCRDTKITGEGRAHVNQCSALFEIALASLEAEIHSYTFEDDPRPLYTAPPATVDKNPLREFAMEYIESWDLGMAGDSSLLASARKAIADSEILQPAPVSAPDEIEPDDSNTFDYVGGWNACRAAMLQGKPNQD